MPFNIRQTITPSVTLPSVTWRSDNVLDPPVLNFPLDEIKYCPDVIRALGSSSDVTLEWTAVTGATFYVVQICQDSSFSGSTLNAVRTAALTTTLNYIDHIRLGTKMYWRVAAYNTSGGASVMSPTRVFELSCPDAKGVGYDPEDPAASASTHLLDKIGAKLELFGPKQVRAEDTGRTWALNISYNCDAIDGAAVTIGSVAWSVRQTSNAPVTITASDDGKCVLDIDLAIATVGPEFFELTATVTFNVAAAADVEATVRTKVIIEGAAVGGAVLRHGIVREICDETCSTYVVELVDRAFDETCTGAGTGTGTGTAAAGTGTGP